MRDGSVPREGSPRFFTPLSRKAARISSPRKAGAEALRDASAHMAIDAIGTAPPARGVRLADGRAVAHDHRGEIEQRHDVTHYLNPHDATALGADGGGERDDSATATRLARAVALVVTRGGPGHDDRHVVSTGETPRPLLARARGGARGDARRRSLT